MDEKAAQTAETAPVNPHAELEKPQEVKLTDRLRLQLAQERVSRTDAQLVLAQLAHKEAQSILRGVEAGIAQEYGITQKDTIDVDTGKITRGP